MAMKCLNNLKKGSNSLLMIKILKKIIDVDCHL